MARDALERMKDRIDREFMGRGGIHSVGVRRKQRALAVYVNPEPTANQEQTLDEVRQQAQPFEVIVIKDQPPVFAGNQ